MLVFLTRHQSTLRQLSVKGPTQLCSIDNRRLIFVVSACQVFDPRGDIYRNRDLTGLQCLDPGKVAMKRIHQINRSPSD